MMQSHQNARPWMAPSRHDKPFDERRREIREKWKTVRIMARSTKYRETLHPLMAYLAKRTFKGRPKASFVPSKYRVANRISLRIRTYKPLPRFRPFQCSKCLYSSFCYDRINDHSCAKRKRRQLTIEEVEKAIQSGSKSGIKNPLRALECADTPNYFNVDLPKPILHTEIRYKEGLKRPPIPSEFLCSPARPVKDVPALPIANRPSCPTPQFGYLCLSCRRPFTSYTSFDKHLNDTPECLKNGCCDLPFLVKNKSLPVKIPVPPPIPDAISRKCFQCQEEFKTVSAIQAHILECGSQSALKSRCSSQSSCEY